MSARWFVRYKSFVRWGFAAVLALVPSALVGVLTWVPYVGMVRIHPARIANARLIAQQAWTPNADRGSDVLLDRLERGEWVRNVYGNAGGWRWIWELPRRVDGGDFLYEERVDRAWVGGALTVVLALGSLFLVAAWPRRPTVRV